MIRYFKNSIISIKNIVVISLFLILSFVISFAFMNLGDPDIHKIAFTNLYNKAYIRRIITYSKILIFIFMGIIMFDHDTKYHIPILVSKGRFKFYFSKLIFWLIFNLGLYIVMFILILLASHFFAPFFMITTEFIFGFIKGIFDVFLLTILIITFIRDDIKSFTFIFIGLFIALLVLFKTYSNKLYFYKYLIPISESPIYNSIIGYIFFIPYFIGCVIIYFIKTLFEQVRI